LSKHQIIYTSCMRGINSINDGQQIYSYDASFNDSNSDDVKGLFTYQLPSLEPGVVMTEALAKTMPQAFIYRRLNNASCAIVLNTYLGRDYMGSAGRFGNHLSHAVICDEIDLYNYPCEFYGSELLRSQMEFSEVNCSKKPPFLPNPELIKGHKIDVESVIEFLSLDNRMDVYKKMLSAMLAFKSARKRLVICDEPDNIVMWIAALQYALPLKLALNVNFTTYVFDPSLSLSQICGVIPSGSRYSSNNASAHFTFDFFHNIIPDIDTKDEFFEFIDMGMSLSYESLQAFHEFVSTKLAYTEVDERYYLTYSLYCLFADGIENLSLETFKNAVQISNDFALDSEKLALVKKLLDQKTFIISLGDTYSIEIIKVLLARMDWLTPIYQEKVKTLVVEKAISAFTSPTVEKNSFIKFYKELEHLCSVSQMSIPYELMKDKNRDMLLSSMRKDATAWKWEFIVDILCEYILIKPVLANMLSIDFQIGHLIRGIILSVFFTDYDRGFSLLTKIINKFSHDWKYLANMALNLESILFEVQNSEQIIMAFWKHVYQAVAQKQSANRQNIYAFFLTYDRYEHVFGIYSELINVIHSTKEAKELFNEQVNSSNIKYFQEYYLKFYVKYYDYLRTDKEADTGSAKRELLQNVMQKGVTLPFTYELIENILANIPLEMPSKENEKFITMVFDYYIKQKRQGLPHRLLMLVFGMTLCYIKNKCAPNNAIKQLRQLISNENIDLTVLSDINAKKYLDWTVPNIFAVCKSANDLIAIYNLFKLSRISSDWFVVICAKETLKERKDDLSIIAFLEFLFSIGNFFDKKEVGKIFCKLSKKRLESLDLAVKDEFSNRKTYLTQWEDIREVAASTNSLLSNISDLFRGKKEKK